MPKAAWSVAEYLDFMRRRWRFIAGGTILTVSIMAAMTATRPKIYSVWAVIDAGTLSERKGLDYYRNDFNNGRYLKHLPNPDALGVTKAWLLFARPKLMLRVDGDNPHAVVTAANMLASGIIADLSAVMMPPELAPLAEQQAIQQLIADLITLTSERLSRVRTEAVRLGEEYQRLIGDLRTRPQGLSRPVAVLPAEAEKLIATGGAWGDALRESEHLGIALMKAQELRNRRVPAGTMAALGGIRPLPDTAGGLVQQVNELAGVLAKGNNAEPEIRPIRLTTTPEAPALPSWPNVWLNLLVASIFGAVGSTFAAMVRSSDS